MWMSPSGRRVAGEVRLLPSGLLGESLAPADRVSGFGDSFPPYEGQPSSRSARVSATATAQIASISASGRT